MFLFRASSGILVKSLLSQNLCAGWKDSILSLPKKFLAGTHLGYSKAAVPDVEQEPEIPKLPVPDLEQTVCRYLETMKPILDDTQNEKLQNLVDNFACTENSIGPKLQLYLCERQKKLDNWAYDYWIVDMYHANKAPLPVNSNPGMVFPPRKFTTVLDVARFAARLLDGMLAHKEVLDKRAIPLDRLGGKEKGKPLCMFQYYNIMPQYRLPSKPHDILLHDPTKTSPCKKAIKEHVIVACRNQFYYVPLRTDRGRLSEDDICSQIMHILDDAPCLANPPPIGILTAADRDQWTEARAALCSDKQNRSNLKLIEDALCMVCLDEPLPATFNTKSTRGAKGHTAGQRDETNMMIQMLHGGGSTCNSANRWFDKTIQLVISNDGVNGLCYEHSPAEGVAVILLMEQLIKHCSTLPPESVVPNPNVCLAPPERLEWILEANNSQHIQEAAKSLDNLVNNTDFLVYRFNGFGKDFIKQAKMSPDAFIQLAMQLAIYKLYNKLVCTYESAMVRRFKYGRVDNIRAATMEALCWAQAMCQAEPAGSGAKEDDISGKKDQKKFELLQEAVQKQSEITNQNVTGQGIDVHLLGLREAAKETSPTAASPLPELFTDKTYKIANEFLLSTSQVATISDSFMGYGAVAPDGYGCSYNPKKDSILFCIASFKSSEFSDLQKFSACLEEALGSMQNLINKVKPPAAPSKETK